MKTLSRRLKSNDLYASLYISSLLRLWLGLYELEEPKAAIALVARLKRDRRWAAFSGRARMASSDT